MTGRPMAGLLVLAVAACAGGATAADSDPDAVRGLALEALDARSSSDPAAIRVTRLRAVAPRIEALRVEPARVVLRVGETYDYEAELRVMAYDASGELLGRLMVYDHRVSGRAAYVWNWQVIADRPGETVLTVSVPSRPGAGDEAPPSARVLFVVADG